MSRRCRGRSVRIGTGTPVAAAERTSELAGDTEISAIRAEIPLGPGHRSQRAVTDFSLGESCSEGWKRLLLQNGERKSARHCLDGKRLNIESQEWYLSVLTNNVNAAHYFMTFRGFSRASHGVTCLNPLR